jgi:hypothetical protein
VRVDHHPFFPSGFREDRLILGCYQLAKYYGVAPDHFLKQTIAAVSRHMKWTSDLIRESIEAQERARNAR